MSEIEERIQIAGTSMSQDMYNITKPAGFSSTLSTPLLPFLAILLVSFSFSLVLSSICFLTSFQSLVSITYPRWIFQSSCFSSLSLLTSSSFPLSNKSLSSLLFPFMVNSFILFLSACTFSIKSLSSLLFLSFHLLDYPYTIFIQNREFNGPTNKRL